MRSVCEKHFSRSIETMKETCEKILVQAKTKMKDAEARSKKFNDGWKCPDC